MTNNNHSKKFLVLDSSTVISLSLSELLFVLEEIKKKFPEIVFLLSDDVINEIIDRPLAIKRFKLEALIVKKLINERIIEISSEFIDKKEVEKETSRILEIAGTIFRAKGEYMQIVHRGEASCIALYRILKKQNEKALLVVDERTTRMLCENPNNLHRLLESKLHTKIEYAYESADFFRNIEIIRSAEICAFAFRKKILRFPGSASENIDAFLYALKFHGCSISSEEIEEEKQILPKI